MVDPTQSWTPLYIHRRQHGILNLIIRKFRPVFIYQQLQDSNFLTITNGPIGVIGRQYTRTKYIHYPPSIRARKIAITSGFDRSNVINELGMTMRAHIQKTQCLAPHQFWI